MFIIYYSLIPNIIEPTRTHVYVAAMGIIYESIAGRWMNKNTIGNKNAVTNAVQTDKINTLPIGCWSPVNSLTIKKAANIDIASKVTAINLKTIPKAVLGI